MTNMLLAAWYHTVLALLFAVVAALLIIVILLQRGRGVGLAGAFGGTGAHATFGAKTGDFLTWLTVGLAALFLLFAVFLNYIFVETAPDLGPGAGGGPQPISPGSSFRSDWSADRLFSAAPGLFGEQS